MKLQTPVADSPCQVGISYKDRILMLGSCFSDNIGKQLSDFGFDVCVNPFGTLYNPESILSAVRRLISREQFTDEDCEEIGAGDMRICSFSHHTSHARATREEFLSEANLSLEEAADFFMLFADLPHIPRVAIENPVGVMSTRWRKPDQIIHPYMFGDPFEKKTCLWLKGLDPLKPTDEVEPEPRKQYASGNTMPAWYADAWRLPKDERAKLRSKTFPGIAKAIAEQWAGPATITKAVSVDVS